MEYYNETDYGRDIIDDIVVSRRDVNPSNYAEAVKLPPYFGSVNNGYKKLRFTSTPKKFAETVETLITPIEQGVDLLKFSGDAKFVYSEDGEPKTISVHPVLISLVKVLVANSISVIPEYTESLSYLVKYILDSKFDLVLPIDLPVNSKFQKELATELNEYLIRLLDENNIRYSKVVDTPKKRSSLVDAAHKADINR